MIWDWIISWFSSNSEKMTPEQRREVEELLDRLKYEMQDNINSSSSNTMRKLEQIMNAQSSRLHSEIQDSKDYCSNEIKRMSEELKAVKKQLEEEDEKKKKEKKLKENDVVNKMADDHKLVLDMLKLLLAQKTTTDAANTPASGGNPANPMGFGSQWPVYPPVPGYVPPYFPQQAGIGPYPFHQNQQSSYNPHFVNQPGPPGSDLSAPFNVTNTNQLNWPSAAFSADAHKLRAPRLQVEQQFGRDLILPDSRDYNKVQSTSASKNMLGDEQFEQMVENFSRDFNTSSKSKHENNERKIANEVKNFFLKDKLPNSSKETSSSRNSVNEWLQRNEELSRADDGNESDSSNTSVKTDVSRFSSMSATSGKRVFYNKSKNYGKPGPSAGRSQENTKQPFDFNKKKNNARYSQNQNQRPNWRSRGAKSTEGVKDPGTDCESTASTRTMSEIHYPSEREAREKNIDLNKPLKKDLLFLGKNEDDEWVTHTPKTLSEIYKYEKKYKVFRTIEMS